MTEAGSAGVGGTADGVGDRVGEDAELLRSAIGSILGRDASRAILAPGALVSLRLLFRQLGVESLILSDREYYGPEHFPACDVRVAPVEAIPDVAEAEAADAVLVSLVSWKGEKADLEGVARDLPPSAMLCVDWCHAGALGFPPIGSLEVDLVFGDATKWLISMDTPDRLAFLLGRKELEPVLERCFAGLYLSGGGSAEREARWIDPHALSAMARSVNGAAENRAVLESRHARNVALARAVAAANDLSEPDTTILWIPDAVRSDLDLSDLPSEELAWEIGGGVRVLCQAAP